VDSGVACPIRFNDRLTRCATGGSRGDGRPPEAYAQAFEELSGELAVLGERLDRIPAEELPNLNRRLNLAGLPEVRSGGVG
jgi:hypothetical protein